MLARLAGLELTPEDTARLDADLDRLLAAIDALPPVDPSPPPPDEAPPPHGEHRPPPPIAVDIAPCRVPRVVGEP